MNSKYFQPTRRQSLPMINSPMTSFFAQQIPSPHFGGNSNQSSPTAVMAHQWPGEPLPFIAPMVESDKRAPTAADTKQKRKQL
jgi:hypothetical protein